MIVVDTNTIAYLFISGEHTPVARELLKYDNDWISPVLWKSEFRNVLLMYIRKGFLKQKDALLLMREAENLMLGNEYEILSENVFDLAVNSSCSAYDCEFVALAKKLDLKLYTSDKKILSEFPEYSVSLKEFK